MADPRRRHGPKAISMGYDYGTFMWGFEQMAMHDASEAVFVDKETLDSAMMALGFTVEKGLKEDRSSTQRKWKEEHCTLFRLAGMEWPAKIDNSGPFSHTCSKCRARVFAFEISCSKTSGLIIE